MVNYKAEDDIMLKELNVFKEISHNKSNYWIRICLIFVFLIFCPGCVYLSHQKYPESNKLWAEEGTQCIDIEGVYYNANFPVEDKRMFKNTSTISLASNLISSALSDQKVDKVRINQDGSNTLEILALDGERVIANQKYYLERKDYQCKNGRIIFKYRYPDMGGMMGIPLYNSNHLELSKTINSDLVLSDFTAGYNILIIPPIPLFGNESVLYFFKKIE